MYLSPPPTILNTPQAPSLLHSWKEIAGYFERSVRTVQRWEQTSGLPVHRPSGRQRSAVLAFAHELEEWKRGNTEAQAEVQPEPAMIGAGHEKPRALVGWSALSLWCGRSIRTLQRWERGLNLPVHREGANRGPVVAYSNELGNWFLKTPILTPSGKKAA